MRNGYEKFPRTLQLQKKVVCEKHFEEEDLIRYKKKECTRCEGK